MQTWAPLSNSLVDSSIWEEPDPVFRVFMAMMSLKDADHVLRMDGYKLARRIHMPIDVVTGALEVLASPDTKREGQDFDGRRIERVGEGWLILNGEKYREMAKAEMKRARNAKAQAAWRERKKAKGPLPGEVAAVAAMERGDEVGAAAIAEAALPEAPKPPLPIPEVDVRRQEPRELGEEEFE